jgi:hypothetical protein
MTTIEPFDTIETAIIEAFDAEGLAVYPYEAETIAKHPAGTLVPELVTPNDTYQGPDQGFSIGACEYVLRIYHRADKNAALAWRDARANLRLAFDVLGADRSLGGAVRSVDIVSTSFQPVIAQADGRAELMVEVRLLVMPKPS